MKNVVLIFIAILTVFTSCKETAESVENLSLKINQTDFPQKWTLVSMSGNLAGVRPTTGKNMDYQEFYILNKDGTFTKTRNRNGLPQTVRGIYSIHRNESSISLILTHDVDNELIGNCLANRDEELVFQDENTLKSTWQACDGPGLIYSRGE